MTYYFFLKKNDIIMKIGESAMEINELRNNYLIDQTKINDLWRLL